MHEHVSDEEAFQFQFSFYMIASTPVHDGPASFGIYLTLSMTLMFEKSPVNA